MSFSRSCEKINNLKAIQSTGIDYVGNVFDENRSRFASLLYKSEARFFSSLICFLTES